MLNISGHQEMQIKTTVGFHGTFLRVAKIKKTEYQGLLRMWSIWTCYTLLVAVQNDTIALENSSAISEKFKHKPTISLSSSTPRCLFTQEK